MHGFWSLGYQLGLVKFHEYGPGTWCPKHRSLRPWLFHTSKMQACIIFKYSPFRDLPFASYSCSHNADEYFCPFPHPSLFRRHKSVNASFINSHLATSRIGYAMHFAHLPGKFDDLSVGFPRTNPKLNFWLRAKMHLETSHKSLDLFTFFLISLLSDKCWILSKFIPSCHGNLWKWRLF